MPNNHLEAVTYKKFLPGEAGVDGANLSYADLDLSDLMLPKDQLSIIRKFSFTAVDDLVNSPPTTQELETLYTLPHDAKSGSPMFVLDEVNKKIIFSTTASDYTWVNGRHHTRGADLVMPVVDFTNDTIIITRRTFLDTPVIKWITGAKVTATVLNTQTSQLLQAIQELRTKVLTPIEFDYSIGASKGICPLDANGVIPLIRIPEELGGQGALAVDLSDKVLKDLQDVSTSGKVAGHVLQWNPDHGASGSWVNDVPLKYAVDFASAVAYDVLRWTGTAWELAAQNLYDLGNVDTTGLGEASIIYFDHATGVDTWKIGGQLWDDASYPTLTDNHILTWNTENDRWEAKVHPFYTYQVFDLSDISIFQLKDAQRGTIDPEINDTDILAWKAGFWMPKSIDTWDLNNIWYGEIEIEDPSDPGYSGGVEGPQMWSQFLRDGHILYWDKRLPQKDDQGVPNGSFHSGPIFSGSHDPWTGESFVNLNTASPGDVIKWRIEARKTPTGKRIPNHWEQGKLNLNHLGDVEASYYDAEGNRSDPNDGDVIKWVEADGMWKTFAGPAEEDGLLPGETTQFWTNIDLALAGESYTNDEIMPPVHYAVWPVPLKKIKMNTWSLHTNINCEIMLKLYDTTFAGWAGNNQSSFRMDKGGEVEYNSLHSEYRANGEQPVGWGMKHAGYGFKKKVTQGALKLHQDEMEEDHLLVVVLHWLRGETGNAPPPSQISLNILWDVLEF